MVRERAPAKINLYLHVGRPRADGRHPLESAVAFADVGDEIIAAPAAGLSLSIEGPFAAGLSSGEDNLVLRAARALALAAGIHAPGAALTLRKHLPVASGMGGGSADAAATLRALNELWGCDFPLTRLEAIARGLGADAPVCVRASPAFMSGFGEETAPMAQPTLDAVLVNPSCVVETGAVFRRFDALGLGEAFTRGAAPDWRSMDAATAALSMRRNDLTAPAIDLAPEIADALRALEAGDGVRLARMSGSGATVFAIMNDPQSACALAARVAASHPGWWCVATTLNAIDGTGGKA